MRAPLLFLAGVLTFSSGVTAARAAAPFSAQTERDAAALVHQMTLEEKVGQMIQPDYNALLGHEDDVTRLAIGSVLNGGTSDPGDNSAKAWADAAESLQRRALATRLKIPLLYGIDAVHGNNNIPGAVIFPHNIGLGATRDPALVERAARVTALEVLGTGQNWTFAPGVIVGRDERWGRTYESYAEDPMLVGKLGAAATRGFQTANLGNGDSILACAKHFLADGGTTKGVDQGNTVCDEPTLRRLFLTPYVDAVNAGVGSVMISYSSWNGQKMHGNRHLITEVLKGELGFRGFTVSDWAAIDQLGADYASDIEQSVNAGLDMVMIPYGPGHANNYAEFAAKLLELVHSGKVSEARVTDAAERILRVKLAMRLTERPLSRPDLFAQLGSADHRAVAREAVQHSLVLLQNRRHALPLASRARHILVTGSAADDLGAQCGGWTVSWQGDHGATTTGTTLLTGLRQLAPAGCDITFAPKGETPATRPDAIIVTLAEDPYAEGKGDRDDLNLPETDRALVRQAHATGAPVIVVLFSGRPRILGDIVDNADAIVAAWLPGTEGTGIADVLWGRVKPTGKLPVSWPRSMAQIPINVGDAKYDPLFAYGFGLGY